MCGDAGRSQRDSAPEYGDRMAGDDERVVGVRPEPQHPPPQPLIPHDG